MIKFYIRGSTKIKFINAVFRQKGIWVVIATGIQITIKNWDRKKQRVRNVIEEPNRDLINHRLDKIQTLFQKLYLEHCFENPTKEKIKQILTESIKGKVSDKMTLNHWFDLYIEELGKRTNVSTGRPITTETINKFKILKDRLFSFRADLDFEHINRDFYIDFTELLRVKKDFKPNTIGKYIRALNEVLNRATAKGYNKNRDFANSDFKIKNVETEAIYLTKDELKRIFDLDLSNNPPIENAS